MRKIKIFAITLAIVLSLAAGIFAVGKLTTQTWAKAETCCPNSSCCQDAASCCNHHKAQTASANTEKAACCGDASCCADGKCKMNGACCAGHDNCPMKNAAQTVAYEKAGVAVENAGGKECHQKQTTQAAEGKADCCASGAACCNGGACCGKKNAETKASL